MEHKPSSTTILHKKVAVNCLMKKPRPKSSTGIRRQTLLQLKQENLANKSPASTPDTRLLDGYTKVKKLGSGGFGTVWHVVEASTNSSFALKQIPKDNAIINTAVASGIVEARVGQKLFPTVDVVGDKLIQYLNPSISQLDDTFITPNQEESVPSESTKFIAQLYRVVETKQDIWLLFEQGGDTLHNSLFEIKGDFYQGSRTYKIIHRPLYIAMRENISILKIFLRQLIASVQTLNQHQLVHADIKPDNILVSHYFENGRLELSTKLIDFGSSFSSLSPRLTSATTPEYVPPDVLELIRTKYNANHIKLYFQEHCCPHSFDMWSVGCVFLEIACGVPIWFSYKSRVDTGSNTPQQPWVTGLMSSTGRKSDKIAQRQVYVAGNLEKCIRKSPGMNIDSKRWKHGIELLQKMLAISPSQRISPQDALAHPFLKRS
ncbi:kinase domain containing protein [Thraustotheca clavata]|uniref:Kinase domain containing protein n=1 Tax=Thraustotheca clavata TaxID=74557 RepID=A0A1V9ZZR0_9STRA|nr:kinase domain containing protein [Thraustotheca clavata]